MQHVLEVLQYEEASSYGNFVISLLGCPPVARGRRPVPDR